MSEESYEGIGVAVRMFRGNPQPDDRKGSALRFQHNALRRIHT